MASGGGEFQFGVDLRWSSCGFRCGGLVCYGFLDLGFVAMGLTGFYGRWWWVPI